MLAELRTARLQLRPPRAADAAAAFERWAADVEVLRYLGQPAHQRVEQTRAQLAWDEARWLKRSAWTWVLLHPGDGSGSGPDGEPIGLISLTPQRLDGPPHHLRLGYLLARSHWGRGLMAEALRAVLTQVWGQEPACWRIDAVCDVDNPASARVLERLGFEREGRLRRHTLHPNVSAEPRDVWLYARIREPEPVQEPLRGPQSAPDPGMPSDQNGGQATS